MSRSSARLYVAINSRCCNDNENDDDDDDDNRHDHEVDDDDDDDIDARMALFFSRSLSMRHDGRPWWWRWWLSVRDPRASCCDDVAAASCLPARAERCVLSGPRKHAHVRTMIALLKCRLRLYKLVVYRAGGGNGERGEGTGSGRPSTVSDGTRGNCTKHSRRGAACDCACDCAAAP